MARKMIVLRSALSLEMVAETLRREMDEERWTLFSLSGLKGNRSVVGKVDGEQVRLRKRVHLHNDFAGQFFGRMTAEAGGTRIEGYFDFPRRIRYFMWGWLAVSMVIAIPIFAVTISDLVHGTHWMGPRSGDWVGLVVAPAFLAYALLLPRVGRWFGRGGERYILHFMETTLAARVE